MRATADKQPSLITGPRIEHPRRERSSLTCYATCTRAAMRMVFEAFIAERPNSADKLREAGADAVTVVGSSAHQLLGASRILIERNDLTRSRASRTAK